MTEANTLNTEDAQKTKWLKTAKWIYWSLTIFFAGSMVIAGVMYLAGAKPVEGVVQLGYPLYICSILGAAKVLGGVAILWGRFPLLKEWAYAGYSFNLIGAAASYVLSGAGPEKALIPLTLLVIVLISYRQWKTGWM